MAQPPQVLPESGGGGLGWAWVPLASGVLIGLGLAIGRRNAERNG